MFFISGYGAHSAYVDYQMEMVKNIITNDKSEQMEAVRSILGRVQDQIVSSIHKNQNHSRRWSGI